MRVEYDPETDAGYLRLSEAAIADSEQVRPGIVFDYDADGRVVGIELLHLRKQRPDIDLQKLEQVTG